MKAKPYQVNALVPQIKNGYRGALIFGPDIGLVQELSEKVAQMIVSDLSDSFCVSKINPLKIKEIPSILLDDGNAPSLLGNRKLIWFRDADNVHLEAIENYFQNIKTNAFLLVTSGNLTKNSSLRHLFDERTDTLSIACYIEETKDIAVFIRETLVEQHIQISPKELSLLTEKLCENRLMIKQELNKLITYLGNKKTVEVPDIQAVITDIQNSSTDLFCIAVASGQREEAEKEYRLMLQNGENPVSIIRILYLYFNKLLAASEALETQGMATAIKKIMKPSQFRLEASFQKQLNIWKKSYIFKVLNLILEAERQAKSTAFPAELILDRVIMQITGVAQRYML